MASTTTIVLTSLAVLIGLLVTVQGLECYYCTGVAGTVPGAPSVGLTAGCKDKFDSASATTTCTSGNTCQKTKYSHGDNQWVARTCSSACTKGSSSSGDFKVVTTCCTGAKCNGAGSVRAQWLLPGLLGLLLGFCYFM